jgi:hypothetical protein
VPTSSYTYLVPAAELENSNQLQQGYETCAISTSASLANLARAEGFEPPSSALETDSLTLSLRPRFSFTNCQRAIKNPALGRVRCIKTNTLRPSRHDSPNDPLGHSGYLVFEDLLHKSHSQLQSTSIRDALQFSPCRDRILLPRPSPRQLA